MRKTWGWRGAIKALALVASVGMFVVLAMGTAVTNTGSAQGCGRDWPLCRGKFIPEFAVKTFIEFSHRAVTGVEGLLIVALAVGALVLWRRREMQVLVPLMLAFLLIQAVLGGLAVKYPETPAVLALHFGISLIAFAAVLLVTAVIWEADGADALRDRPLPRGFFWSTWGLIVFTYVVVYIGAYVRHKGLSLACPDWPLCRGAVVPPLPGGATTFALVIVLLHRYSAAALLVATLALFLWARRLRRGRPDLYRGSVAALITLGGQALAGGWVVYSHLSLFSTLFHAAMVALYFGALSYLCLHTLARPAAYRKPLVRRAGPEAPRSAVAAPVAEGAERG
jgi:heme a synthase